MNENGIPFNMYSLALDLALAAYEAGFDAGVERSGALPPEEERKITADRYLQSIKANLVGTQNPQQRSY